LDAKNWQSAELIHLYMYVRNSYALDIHNTNILYFFEQELKNCGFSFQSPVGKRARIDKTVTLQFDAQTQKIRDDKYDLLLESFETPEMILPDSITVMKERCQLLKLTSAEEVNEYRELVEDSAVLDHFFNYNGLKKPYEYCEGKVRDTINAKMIAGVEKSRWFKIKYIHLFAKLLGIEGNFLSVEDIEMPELTEKNKTLIDNIKKLYGKRDKVKVEDYELDSIKQLYRFMLDNLTKKLKLFCSSRSNKRDDTYKQITHKINDNAVKKYDKLISIMNPQTKVEYNLMFEEDEEE